MSNDEKKADFERTVFRKFAAAAGLPVPLQTIQSRPPPEPDILCQVGDERVAFELVDLLDQGLAHAIAKTLADPDHPHAVSFGDPTLDSIRAKMKKHYESPHPMELVAHGGDTLLPENVWMPKFSDHLRALFDQFPSPFRRLWVVNLGPRAAKNPVWLVHPQR